jgi:hypothetical protein
MGDPIDALMPGPDYSPASQILPGTPGVRQHIHYRRKNRDARLKQLSFVSLIMPGL